MYIFIWELLKRDQELHPCGVLKQNIITVTNESNVKTYNWVAIGWAIWSIRHISEV